MSKDHFVSVTFLKNFAQNIDQTDPRKTKVFVYNKSQSNFESKEISIESRFYENGRDGKKGNNFVQKLKYYEPKWDCYLDQMNKASSPVKINFDTKEGIASYLALLSLNNPKKAIGRASILQNSATSNEIDHIKKEYGDWGKQDCQLQVRNTLVYLGHFHTLTGWILSMPWVIFKNQTGAKFITSDDPIIVSEHGWYIPVSKNTLLLVSIQGHDEGVRNIDDLLCIKQINEMMRNNAHRFCVSCSNNKNDVFE